MASTPSSSRGIDRPLGDARLLVHEAASGNRRALGRLLSLLERGGEDARQVSRVVFPRTGRAYTVGITGPLGVGKSTLVDHVVARIRADGDQVGVVAVDPSSARSGGAVLGDRVRMQRHGADPSVFIRSMATRGHPGGLAAATREAARALDATGRPWVLVETVGAGQGDVDVASVADTTVVVVNPGWGDDVQAAKAGLLEVADVFVVNKIDLPNASDAWRSLEAMLELAPRDRWRPPVVGTVGSAGEGIDRLWEAVCRHRASQEESGLLQRERARRLAEELRMAVGARLEGGGSVEVTELEAVWPAVAARQLHPVDAAEQFLSARSNARLA